MYSFSLRPFGPSSALALFAALACVVGPAPSAQAELPRIVLGTSIPLECASTGGSQDAGKTMVIKNTSIAKIPKGHTLHWQSSDGDKGTMSLGADLPVGATTQAIGAPKTGNYTCTAKILSNPDLVVAAAQFKTQSSIQVDVFNADGWIPAGESVARVQVVSCSGQVLQTYESKPFGLAPAATKLIYAPLNAAPKSFIRVTVDAKQQVIEKNETNNTWDNMDTCVK